ncbi:hypothetical protein HNQ93_000381 [Hymenobacter luteus]|uniref:Uncharacterized protein n=2 Tax=Hymenobacter TaxID=89966 RepID=A0A7W9SXJ8_9BACT|nr:MULTISPECIES: hypothetical protein [Hymenobacter]MBB4600139.1 hypothetical protein [Hymenobacter latericoloratus]MBB6057551.1 hypothetical protein [Hymenobacter luteus]
MLSFTRLLARLRFACITATLLMVLGLNHQAVATLRVLPASGATHVSAGPRAAVVKQRVTLEATSPLGFFVAPAADAWFPQPLELPVALWLPACPTGPNPLPSAVPDWFRVRLLVAALSPQAP